MNVLPWLFGRKPKSPGFGISKNFYLTVLATSPILPSMRDLTSQKPINGEVLAMGAPLAKAATKEDLFAPLSFGAYGVVSIDKRTLIKMLVVDPEKAGFDPLIYTESADAANASPEVISRVKGAWTMTQLNVETYDPGVYHSMRIMMRLAKRIGEMSVGVIADPISQRYQLPDDFYNENFDDEPLRPQELVEIHQDPSESGLKLYTLGLQKIDLPELELDGVDPSDIRLGVRFLLRTVKLILSGKPLELDDKLGSKDVHFQVASGGFNRKLWEGIPVFELIPSPQFEVHKILEAIEADASD